MSAFTVRGNALVSVKSLKKSDYFQLVEGGAMYVRGDWDASSRRYDCSKFDDINAYRSLKGDKLVIADATF